MSNDLAIYLSKQLLWQAIVISSPVVIVAMLTGFISSILQVITQIQDATLTAVPKIFFSIIMLMFCGGWMLRSLSNFATQLIQSIPVVLKW